MIDKPFRNLVLFLRRKRQDASLESFKTALHSLTFPEVGTDIPGIMQAVRWFEIEPKFLASEAIVGFGGKNTAVPTPQKVVIHFRRISRDDRVAAQSAQCLQESLMIVLGVVVTVHTCTATGLR